MRGNIEMEIVNDGKTYKQIDFFVCSIAEAVLELIKYEVKGQLAYGDFNGIRLFSDTVSINSAYMQIVGKTKYEFEQEQKKWRIDYEKEKKEHEDAIPELVKEWIQKGHEILTPDKFELWDTCVPIRLGDLYRGMELGQCLELVKLLKTKNYEEASKVHNKQGHSGMSHHLLMSMIKEFSENGEEFAKYLASR